MLFESTGRQSPPVDGREATLRGLAPDGGLYVPTQIPVLAEPFRQKSHPPSLQDVGRTIARAFFSDILPPGTLDEVVNEALDFPVELVEIADGVHILELFHGPSLAFKDFGARFMARLLARFQEEEGRERLVLVATSGDTGSAVAQGFSAVSGVRVVLLYPAGKVSQTQEKQLTTAGGNVTALRVEGTFDDCQALVKRAFADYTLCARHGLTSANSINIARLLPQSFYHAWASLQLPAADDLIVTVPSGNLGNLTAGLYARAMGFPIPRLLAAANANRVLPDFLTTGEFQPRPSLQTIANAMDVGNPSNFARIAYFFADDLNSMQKVLTSHSCTDEQIRAEMGRVYQQTGYILDPHTAVGSQVFHRVRKTAPGIILATAHPGKFADEVSAAIGHELPLPPTLTACLKKKSHRVTIPAQWDEFVDALEVRK